MNTNKIFPDDPRLTAYALNEMTPAERAEFEQTLAQDAEARQAVAEISRAAATLTSALEMESELDAEAPAALKATGSEHKTKRDPYAKISKFPYWTISSLAAACFAAFFIYWQRHEFRSEPKQYLPVSLVESKEKAGSPAMAAEQASRENLEAGATASEAKKASEVVAKDRTPAEQDEPVQKTVAMNRVAPVIMPSTLRAQSAAAAPAAAGQLDAADQKIVLSPFQSGVPANKPDSTPSTLAGTRVRTELRDSADSISVVTGQYLKDTGTGVGHQWGVTDGAAIGGSKAVEPNTETYAYRRDNDYLRAADNPLSTFSVDVDTASYANVRRFLIQGQRPPADAVRIEELINYFPYDYAGPVREMSAEASENRKNSARASGMAEISNDQNNKLGARDKNPPFSAHLEVADAPWAPEHRLVRIGLKGLEVGDASRPAANLVFLLDVSGSMNEPNKLPLVKQALRLLVNKLRPDDHVAIAVYAGASGLALPSTPVAHKAEILDAIDRLEAAGSTNGAMGIQLAYDIAKANFIAGGVNRVILATDGDFNVGVTSEGELVRMIEEKAKSGVFLTVLGFGMGNFKDATLERLADKGNGNYDYIDNLAEAKKTLVEQAGSTLVTIAKDVKIQVEFNPAKVQAYRLIGYENRLLAKEDFNNDKVDAGEIGAGHAVTALYEVIPVGVAMPAETGSVDALRYQAVGGQRTAAGSDLDKVENRKLTTEGSVNSELLTVKIRYKEPAGETSNLLEFSLRDNGASFGKASDDFKFAAAVAAFGMVLRDSPYKGASTLGNVVAWGRAGLGSDPGGYRNEFIGLVERAVQVMQ